MLHYFAATSSGLIHILRSFDKTNLMNVIEVI